METSYTLTLGVEALNKLSETECVILQIIEKKAGIEPTQLLADRIETKKAEKETKRLAEIAKLETKLRELRGE